MVLKSIAIAAAIQLSLLKSINARHSLFPPRSWIVICHSFPQLLQELFLGISLGNNTMFRSQPLQFIQRLLRCKRSILTSHNMTVQIPEKLASQSDSNSSGKYIPF